MGMDEFEKKKSALNDQLLEAQLTNDGGKVGELEKALQELEATKSSYESLQQQGGKISTAQAEQVDKFGGDTAVIEERAKDEGAGQEDIDKINADTAKKLAEITGEKVADNKQENPASALEDVPSDFIEKNKQILESETQLNALLLEIEKSRNELDKFRKDFPNNVSAGNEMMSNLSSLWEKRDELKARLEKLTFDPQKAEEERKEAVDAIKEELNKIPDMRPYDKEAEKAVVAKYYEKGDNFGFSDQEKETLNKYLNDIEGVLKAEERWFGGYSGAPRTRAEQLGNPENVIGQAEEKLQDVIKRLIENDDKRNLRMHVINYLIDSPENRFSLKTQKLLLQAYEKLDEGPMVSTIHSGTGEQMDFRPMYEKKVAALKKHIEEKTTPVN